MTSLISTLAPQILKAIKRFKFFKLPIQQKVIPQLKSSSRDIIAAQTGTGKTAAFGLPLIDLVRNKGGYTQKSYFMSNKGAMYTNSKRLKYIFKISKVY